MSWDVRSIEEVAARQLCSGCGACAYADPERWEMIDTTEYGRQPRRRAGATASDADVSEALEMCPGLGVSRESSQLPADAATDLLPAWGPVIEIWEGHAADPELRFAASSGGVASALALHAIERGGAYGVLHISSRSDVPYLNRSVLSRSRREILAAAGSRYAPASPCEGLHEVESAPAPCVFIGKPCDVAATRMARRLRSKLHERLGLTIGIFCAGTPSLRGTLEMMRLMGASEPADVKSVRYRGRGWPGNASVVFDGPDGVETADRSYAESWGDVLQKHRIWRCHICADHAGELADVAVGDPWHREIEDGEAGRSLILVRSDVGREALRAALADGYVEAERVQNDILPDSQPNLLRGRGSVWGRIWTLRLLGLPAPRFPGMPLFRYWWRGLTLAEKMRSVFGTVRRIGVRELTKRIHPTPFDPHRL